MAFHEVRFPESLSFGSLGGPERRTEIVTFANGYEERNTPWAQSRRRYDAGLGLRSLDDLETVIAFFEARHGMLHAFRWKDWGDFKSARASQPVAAGDQVLARSEGAQREFRLVKHYVSGASSVTRPIRKPVAGTVRIAVDGIELAPETGWSVDGANGIVIFDAPPPPGATVTAGFEFDVPVRFDTDLIQVSMAGFAAGEIPKIPVVEVRL
jgi:uncharacterized protein (TIGR02217 family)